MELDEVDKAIVRELQHDGRMSYADLGPKVGLSQAAARQRVNRLIDRGVMQVVAVTDPGALGFTHQAMLGINTDGDARAVASTLEQHDEMEYILLTAGRFDLLVEVVCRDAEHLLALVNDVVRPIDGVATVEVMSYLSLVKQVYDWGTR
ncbi:MAG: Lrp/AsnC family transcriptional regulator for asnA, asnC and gidA [Candidatus Poriferisodalaceae bacterium]|jgi:Lrp/AsnC family transcriptional regulator, regulator for asnA, asnC and gidA